MSVKVEEKKETSEVPVKTPLVETTPNTISPSTLSPESFLEEDQKKKLEAVRAFNLERRAETIMAEYENFGKSKEERNRVWEKFANIAKEDSKDIMLGLNPKTTTEPMKPVELDLNKIEDENVRKEILKTWLEKRTGKKFTQAEVIN